LAIELYRAANNDSLTLNLNNIHIVETTQTGNQAYSEMKANKMKWKGEDDATVKNVTYPAD
jgi:hypothetical protein